MLCEIMQLTPTLDRYYLYIHTNIFRSKFYRNMRETWRIPLFSVKKGAVQRYMTEYK